MKKQAKALGIELPEGYGEVSHCEVWPEHWSVLEVFLLCQDQWRIAGDSIIGLDLGVVLSAIDAYNVKNKKQFLEDLQVVARRAVELHNKNRKK